VAFVKSDKLVERDAAQAIAVGAHERIVAEMIATFGWPHRSSS